MFILGCISFFACLVVTARPVIKVDKIPFARYMEEKRALCKFKHGDSMTCPACAPPELPSFVGKKDCNKGHRPWPQAVCLSCAPANATLKEQVRDRPVMQHILFSHCLY